MGKTKEKRSNTPACGPLALLGFAFVLLFSGCLDGGGSLTNLPESEFALFNLHIRLGRVDVDAPANSGILAKAAEVDSVEQITLKHMTLLFTSNLKDTVWDQVDMLSGETMVNVGGPGGGDPGERSVTVDVRLAPLRWWNIEVKTYDLNDSVIHHGVVTNISSKGGQVVSVTVPLLHSRFSVYEARYMLPEMIYAASLPEDQRVYQKIFFSRLELSIDGRVVRDSSSFHPSITSAGSRFITAGNALRGAEGLFFFRPNAAPDTITHLQVYPYVETGRRTFVIRAYGYLEGDSVGHTPLRLLYEGSATLDIAAGQDLHAIPVVLDWKGPGSPSSNDSTITPGHPNWTGAGLQVIIGKTRKITQEIGIPGGVDL